MRAAIAQHSGNISLGPTQAPSPDQRMFGSEPGMGFLSTTLPGTMGRDILYWINYYLKWNFLLSFDQWRWLIKLLLQRMMEWEDSLVSWKVERMEQESREPLTLFSVIPEAILFSGYEWISLFFGLKSIWNGLMLPPSIGTQNKMKSTGCDECIYIFESKEEWHMREFMCMEVPH